MATTQTVRLDVIADISKYQQQFSKIPGFTDKQAARAAEKLVKRLQKAQDQAEKDARAAAKAAAREWEKTGAKGGGISNTAEALDKVSDKAGEVDSILSGVAGALDAVDPKLGAVARGFGDAAGGMEAVSRAGMLSIPVLGAVGVAAAALGAAYLVFTHNLEQAEKRLKASAALSQKVAEGYDLFQKAVESTDEELQKLLGTYDKETAAQEERDRAINLGADRLVNATKLKINELERERKAILENERVNKKTDARLQELKRRTRLYEESIADVNKQRDEALSKSEDITFAQKAEAEATERAAKASRDKAEADKNAADAARMRAEQEAKQAAQMAAILKAGAERNAQVDRELALREKQAALIEDVTARELTASQKIAAEATERLNQAETIAQQRRENAAGDYALRLEAERGYEEARRLILEDYERQRTEQMAAEMDARAQLEEEEARRRGETARRFTETMLSSTAETLSGLSQLAAQSGSGAQARNLFKAAKAANIAMTLMNTYQSAQGALLPVINGGLGPIAGPPAAAAITAAGLTRVALIRKQKMPKFYRGTERVRGGDEVPAVLHRDEAVLNRRAASAMGRGAIREMNETGRADVGQRVVAIAALNHRQFNDFYFDDRSLPGSLSRRDRNTSGTRIGRQVQ